MYKQVLSFVLFQFVMISLSFSQQVDPHFEKVNKAFMQPASTVVLVAAHRGAHLEARKIPCLLSVKP